MFIRLENSRVVQVSYPKPPAQDLANWAKTDQDVLVGYTLQDDGSFLPPPRLDQNPDSTTFKVLDIETELKDGQRLPKIAGVKKPKAELISTLSDLKAEYTRLQCFQDSTAELTPDLALRVTVFCQHADTLDYPLVIAAGAGTLSIGDAAALAATSAQIALHLEACEHAEQSVLNALDATDNLHTAFHSAYNQRIGAQ